MGFGGNAMAAEQTASVQVNASILPSCSFVLPNGVHFTYNPSDTNRSAGHRNGNFEIICTKTTPYEVGITSGAGGSSANRVMKSGENTLIYTLAGTNNVTQTIEWGDIGSENSLKDVGSGENRYITYDFKIPHSQYVTAGAYSDELVITFNY